MKIRHLIIIAGMMSPAAASASQPDSVFIRPDIHPGDHSMYISYSMDRKHWQRIDCALFDGDYGAWGSQKKIYYPVLTYDGKMFHATFFPDPDYLTDNAQGIRTSQKYGQIATTESRDLRTWKPQDYPFIPEAEYRQRLEAQKVASARNVITIPYSALKGFRHMAQRNVVNAQWEAEDYVATAKPIADNVSDITLKMNINLDDTKAISPNLIGAFFEDISYAADGGIYAELIQNRDFEYTGKDGKGWNSMTAWTLSGNGTTIDISSDGGISRNNPHYAVLKTTSPGAQLVNSGWDGISVKAKAKYLLSLFVKGSGTLRISLMSKGTVLAQTSVSAGSQWKQRQATLTPSADATDAVLVIEPQQAGEVSLDFVSLFPKDTFKGRQNGLRKDLAQTIADMHPRFIRFPGGCASHGNGIDNIYHWKASVGKLWDRQPDSNIWHYHQTRGLGFYEYFQYCEDIGADPLPVLSAGVPCQNSSNGGNGQNGGIPWAKQVKEANAAAGDSDAPLTMESYLQELLDLIEWANGDARTSQWARLRAEAGHPKPFNLKYLGIGNEDLMSDVFMERYLYLINGVKKAHPEITIVGTVGPFWQGSDYEYGWRAAKDNNLEIVDEHYYNSPGWYFHHRNFYDDYSRKGTKVYLGEWASKGTMASNALIEAAYLTNIERNADVVRMSSYAPLLAKDRHTNWNPSLIYFDNDSIHPTANYYVQRLFGQNSGDSYAYSDITVDYKDARPAGNNGDTKPLLRDITNRIDRSVVIDSRTGDVIIKLVSLLPKAAKTEITLPESFLASVGKAAKGRAAKGSAVSGWKATATVLAAGSDPSHARQWQTDTAAASSMATSPTSVAITLPAWSVTVIRISR